ncbi:efflux RND transporter permease subunit [Cohaesibacter gelatinilyticus]|uniref:Multidrug efflux pump subunit AcrB n=1 Tax=Cohaesibacter gelatinilyticus TaxID=372072 RepID=A0A285NCS9_9HYPH|nr:efflux RND transporter permease subunit [Cohaesibacter gelatinilyticus]SNZ07229.1 Multidrug efflux pump subunit AcrB [Cohaesibacter gelatinilyticus]
MDLAKFAIEKRLVSALLTLVILLLGYVSYTSLPRFEDPEFIIRSAQVITPYSGASAEEVSEEVTDVIETAIQQLAGIKKVTSTSSAGLSKVTVEFTIAAAKTRDILAQKFTQLRAKISDTERQLPPNAGTPQVYDDYGDVYAQYYAVTGDGYSLSEIHHYLDTLQRELVLVKGVSKVIQIGVPQEIIYVNYQPSRLIQLGLSASQIAQVLEGQNLVVSGGSVKAGNLRVVFRPGAAVSSLQSLEELVISDPKGGRSFRLKDIATVTRGIKDPISKRLYRDGKPAIGLAISNVLGGNVVEMGDAVRARIKELESLRPVGIDIIPVSEQSESVRISVNDFVLNVVMALGIVVGTLLLFMGIRSGLLMGGILLVTVAGTLLGMNLYGLDMQRISLGALIIALGMLVDNAIVVVEGTLVRIHKGESPASAAVAVVNQTKWPLLGGTVVGFLAFSPIGFSPDGTGEYAGSLFWTISIALLFSWLIAIWLTPYYCTVMLKGEKASKNAEGEQEGAFLAAYRKLLTFALHYRYVTIILAFGLLGLSFAATPYMKQGFFPSSTRAQFVVDYFLPEGTDIEQTQNDTAKIAEHIRGLPGVTGTNRMAGGGHPRFMLIYDAGSDNNAYGQILVDVKGYEDIDPLLTSVREYIEANFPAAFTKVWKFKLGPGGGSAIEAKFTGQDSVVLRELSEQAKRIYAEAGAVAVKDDWREMVKVIRPRIREENMRRLGLTQGDITKAIAAHFSGTAIGVYREGDELQQILFRPDEADRKGAETLQTIQIFNSGTGKYIPITQVVESFDTELENAQLLRENRALAIKAQADPAPGDNATDLFARVKGKVEAIDLPVGYNLKWGGESGDSAEANAGLASTMPLGFGAMVLVVFLLFNAVRQPVIIWLTVPLIGVGIIWGLIVTGTALEFMGILAVLSLTGMLIKNAIVLIDQTDLEISEGKPRLSAVIDSSVSRVRPVSLGVLTTVLGVVPLLWDPFFKSLAVVIIFGLSFATLLTLIVVPTLYSVFFRVKGDETVKEG